MTVHSVPNSHPVHSTARDASASRIGFISVIGLHSTDPSSPDESHRSFLAGSLLQYFFQVDIALRTEQWSAIYSARVVNERRRQLAQCLTVPGVRPNSARRRCAGHADADERRGIAYTPETTRKIRTAA